MGSMRSLAAAAAATISLASVAGLVSGGASAAAATPTPTPAATGVTWHKLTLINGWQSARVTDLTGDPAWAVKDGIAYLTGGMHQYSPASTTFATLPHAARPGHVLYFIVHVPSGTYAFITIYRDGKMTDQSPQPADARSLTSLAAISFPVTATAAHALRLIHGWRSGQGAFKAGDPSYAVKGGVVYLAGSLHAAASGSALFAVLPRGARPAHALEITVYTFDGNPGLLTIYPNGDMLARQGGARLFTSLATVSFPAAVMTRHKLTLINMWQAYSGSPSTGAPSWSLAHGVVYLSGGLTQPTPYSDKFAILPAAARPAHWLWILVYTAGGLVGIVEVHPDGTLWAFTFPAANAQAFTSLAGISYPLNS